MQISAVLFDADGVLQTAEPLFTRFEQQYGWSPQQVREVLRQVTAALGDNHFDAGAADPLPAFAAALADQPWPGSVETFVNELHQYGTEPDPAAFEVVSALRQAGIVCALATNQNLLRARYMDQDLGYHKLFDHCFYSAYLGVAKPDPAFFQAALTELTLAPQQVLFIDDHMPNVAAARVCGLHAQQHTPGTPLPPTLAGYALPITTEDASER